MPWLKNPATGGDTLSPHFWFQVTYYFYSSDFLLHNWNLLGRIYLLTKVIGILGVFYSWGLEFLLKNIGREYFNFFFSPIDHHFFCFGILGVIF